MAARGEFSSKTAFILAASGSAIGLGNIWGFPIKVASNGGGAFVFAYIILTFLLAYPVLMAELVIGRHSKSDVLQSLKLISSKNARPLAYVTAYWAILTAALILSFYAIVAGWMISNGLAPLADMVSHDNAAAFLRDSSVSRDLIFCTIFYALTIYIVMNGVVKGIEKWSTRLMPILILLIISLIVYISTLPGAAQGWSIYLTPDFSRLLNTSLLIDALGQAFFSLSLGVGTMLIYGSYVNKSENLPKLAAGVALMDIGIAFLAGLLVIPAMYVALHNGVSIYDNSGALIDGGRLIFSVLPGLFNSMGAFGTVVAFVFFLLMTLAALTSSISMLEVPVSYVCETHKLSRKKATLSVGVSILLISYVIIFNASLLFDHVVTFTTEFSEPIIGILFCVFVGWVWQRNHLLNELKQGYPLIEQGLFWKVWPYYVRFVCPVVVLIILWRGFSS